MRPADTGDKGGQRFRQEDTILAMAAPLQAAAALLALVVAVALCPSAEGYNHTIRDTFPDVFAHMRDFDPSYKNPCWKNGTGTFCLPYYQILGVSKCGTTDLYSRMISHPDIHDTKNKGPHWWDEDKRRDMSAYLDLFSNAAKKIEANPRAGITGEASSNTLTYSGVGIRGLRQLDPLARGILLPEMLREALPNQKNIVILRNPVDRLYSSFYYYRDYRMRGPPREGEFEEEVARVTGHWKQCVEKFRSEDHCARSLYFLTQQLNKGMYATFLEEWYRFWPQQSFLVIRAEDYYKDVKGVVGEVFGFLGIREPAPQEWEKILKKETRNQEWEKILKKETRNQRTKNKAKGAGAGPMRADTRRRLVDFYRPFNERLSRLTGQGRWLQWS